MGRVDHCRSLLSYCRPCSYCALSPALLIVAIVVLFATLRYANTTPRGGRWAVTVLSVRARVPPSPAPPVAMLSILPPMIELGPNYRYGGAAKPAQAAQTWPDDCVAPEYCTRTYGPELYLRFMTNVTQLICSPPTTVVCASATELLPVCLLPPCRLSVVPDKFKSFITAGFPVVVFNVGYETPIDSEVSLFRGVVWNYNGVETPYRVSSLNNAPVDLEMVLGVRINATAAYPSELVPSQPLPYVFWMGLEAVANYTIPVQTLQLSISCHDCVVSGCRVYDAMAGPASGGATWSVRTADPLFIGLYVILWQRVVVATDTRKPLVSIGVAHNVSLANQYTLLTHTTSQLFDVLGMRLVGAGAWSWQAFAVYDECFSVVFDNFVTNGCGPSERCTVLEI